MPEIVEIPSTPLAVWIMDLIRVKYYFKEHPNTTLSVFFKTQEQAEAFKSKHPDYVYVTTV
jgi:hypothetical protein